MINGVMEYCVAINKSQFITPMLWHIDIKVYGYRSIGVLGIAWKFEN